MKIETREKMIEILFVLFALGLIIFAAYMISIENNDSKVCAFNKGIYSKGLCFKEENIIKIK